MPKPKPPVQSQFAGLKGLSDRNRAKLMDGPDAPSNAPPVAVPPEPIAAAPRKPPGRKRGRPVGKGTVGGYEATTIMMLPQVKANARLYLQLEAARDRKKPKTLSELIEATIIGWCYSQRELNHEAAGEKKYPFNKTFSEMMDSLEIPEE